jgi:hypothetical protein
MAGPWRLEKECPGRNSPKVGTEQPLRVATFNILHGRAVGDGVDPRGFLDCVRRLDPDELCYTTALAIHAPHGGLSEGVSGCPITAIRSWTRSTSFSEGIS